MGCAICWSMNCRKMSKLPLRSEEKSTARESEAPASGQIVMIVQRKPGRVAQPLSALVQFADVDITLRLTFEEDELASVCRGAKAEWRNTFFRPREQPRLPAEFRETRIRHPFPKPVSPQSMIGARCREKIKRPSGRMTPPVIAGSNGMRTGFFPRWSMLSKSIRMVALPDASFGREQHQPKSIRRRQAPTARR